MRRAKILVADYDDKSLANIDEALRQAGYTTVLVRNGGEAIEQIQHEKPDLCIIDPMLPGINGFTVSQKARNWDAKLPIIISTAVYKGDKYQRDAKTKYGVSAYLEKPYTNEQMVKTVDELIAKRPSNAKPNTLDESMERKLGSTLTELASPKKKKSRLTVEANVNRLLEHTLSGIEIGGKSRKVSAPKTVAPKAPPSKKPPLASKVPSQSDDSATMRVSAEDLKREMEKIKQDAPLSQDSHRPQQGLSSMTQPNKTLEEKLTSSDIFGALIDDIESSEPPAAPSKSAPTPARPVANIPAKPASAVPSTPKVHVSPPVMAPPPPAAPAPRTQKKPAPVAAQKPAPPTPAKSTPPIDGPATKRPRPELSKTNEYQLLSKIAAGGMAEVWKARLIGEKGFEKIVAIKKILPHLSDNDEFITMFIDEAKVAANLTHPNIAQIYELGKMGHSFFIAMEYVSGNNLRTIVNLCNELGVTMPQEIASFIGMKLCSALNYAHTKKDFGNRDLNIVHRDISPQNILISSEGEIKLVDFGIAKASIKASQTVAGSLKGKLLYMSPEQADGNKIDSRSDIFSLGNVMYECLTGKKLIDGDSELSILKNVRDANFPKPSSINHKISAGLESIMLKALAKDVDERFFTAKDMEIELKDFMKQGKYHINESDVADFMKSLFARDMSKLTQTDSRRPKTASSSKPAVIMPDTGQVRAHQQMSPVMAKTSSSGNSKTLLITVVSLSLIAIVAAAYFFWPKLSANQSAPIQEPDITQGVQEQPDAMTDLPAIDEATIESITQEVAAEQGDDPNEELKSELEVKREQLRKLYKQLGYTEEQIEQELSKLNDSQ